MRKPENNMLEDVQKCMTDPIYDICKNFSLEKSRAYYEKWERQWNSGGYNKNPADKHEEISFAFTSLDELAIKSIEAQNTYVNLKRKDFIKGCDWYIYWQKIIVSWHRLKTFDEWLHDGLKDALAIHYKSPEDGIRRMLNREWGWYYQNDAIHLFAEWKIDEESLKRLGHYEPAQAIEGRDIEKDIEEATKALKDMEENNKPNDVEVLTLKM